MLLTRTLTRKFEMKGKGNVLELSDPNPDLSTGAVLSYYALLYPELITAKTSGPDIRDDESVWYTFESVMGTKG